LELKDLNAEFLYESDGVFHFSLPQTYEEIEVAKGKVDVIAIPFLTTGTRVRIRCLDEEAIIVKLASKSVPCVVKELLSATDNSKG
jgi:translation elongation factor P/translation initiation factor 5A